MFKTYLGTHYCIKSELNLFEFVSDIAVTSVAIIGNAPIRRGSSTIGLEVLLTNVAPVGSGNNIVTATGVATNYDIMVQLSDVDTSITADTLGLTPATLSVQVCQHCASGSGCFTKSHYFTFYYLLCNKKKYYL